MGNLCKILMTRNGFEDLENIVDIWLLKYFMKLLGSKLYVSNTLTCELLMWIFHFAMILVITPSMWWPVCVMNPLVWKPVYVKTLFMWWPVYVMTLSCGLGWGFCFWNGIGYTYGSHWLKCSFIPTLGSYNMSIILVMMLRKFILQNSNGNSQNYSMFVKFSLS